MSETSDHMIISHLNRIETKVDKVDERLDSVERSQSLQAAHLEDYRSRADHTNIIIRPIVRDHTIAWGLSKIILGISVLLGVMKMMDIL